MGRRNKNNNNNYENNRGKDRELTPGELKNKYYNRIKQSGFTDKLEEILKDAYADKVINTEWFVNSFSKKAEELKASDLIDVMNLSIKQYNGENIKTYRQENKNVSDDIEEVEVLATEPKIDTSNKSIDEMTYEEVKEYMKVNNIKSFTERLSDAFRSFSFS